MIRVEHRDGLLRVSLARAEKRNALTPESLGLLAHAFASPGSSRAAVLDADGSVFCAGFDLPLCVADTSGETMRALLTGLSGAIRAMRASPIPIVAAVHGAALAGGCALLGGVDLVVADRGARFGYPVARIGVSPAVSAPFMLGSLRDGSVRSLLLDPEPIGAVHALLIGLVDELCDTPERALDRAIATAQDLAGKPGIGLRETRALCQRLTPRTDAFADLALETSRAGAGGAEERVMLAARWSSPKGASS